MFLDSLTQGLSHSVRGVKKRQEFSGRWRPETLVRAAISIAALRAGREAPRNTVLRRELVPGAQLSTSRPNGRSMFLASRVCLGRTVAKERVNVSPSADEATARPPSIPHPFGCVEAPRAGTKGRARNLGEAGSAQTPEAASTARWGQPHLSTQQTATSLLPTWSVRSVTLVTASRCYSQLAECPEASKVRK